MSETSALQVTATATGFAITKELVDSIKIRDFGSREKLELGKEYDLSMLDKTEKYNGVEYPVFGLGDGMEISLSRLAHLYVNDENYQTIGKAEDGSEIIPFSASNNFSRVKDIFAANCERRKKIRVTRRVNQGATEKYFNGEHEAARRNAYVLKGIALTPETTDFPLLLLRPTQDEKIADSWRMVPRVAIEAVTTAPAQVAAPVAAVVEPVATPVAAVPAV